MYGINEIIQELCQDIRKSRYYIEWIQTLTYIIYDILVLRKFILLFIKITKNHIESYGKKYSQILKETIKKINIGHVIAM